MIYSYSIDLARNCFRLFVSDLDRWKLSDIVPDDVIEGCSDLWVDNFDSAIVVYCTRDRDVLSYLLRCLDFVHYFDWWNV